MIIRYGISAVLALSLLVLSQARADEPGWVCYVPWVSALGGKMEHERKFYPNSKYAFIFQHGVFAVLERSSGKQVFRAVGVSCIEEN